MKQNHAFLSTVWALAIPVALQSMLQSSFSIVDQIMIGQLGSVAVAGVGLAGKFSSIYTVLISAVGAVAGIMISQYLGQQNHQEVRRSVGINLALGLVLAVGFTALCLTFPRELMGLYSTDPETVAAAGEYLAWIAWTFLPMAGATILSTLFRCMEKAHLPLYASLISAVANTGFNWVLIFGKLGFPELGANGAAIATVISQWFNLVLMLGLFAITQGRATTSTRIAIHSPFPWKQYLTMLAPILLSELVWSLGENVYAAIYGRLGTQASAAMTLTNPIQGLLIGALCGLSQAAAVIIGKRLGANDWDDAYAASKKLLGYGLAGSVVLCLIIAWTSSFYVSIYQVEPEVKTLTVQLLTAYALIAPVKVENMILGSGILRSGGQTKYLLVIDLVGTWGFGVPLGLLSGFVLHLSIPWVYFILSLEECIRLAMGLLVFCRKKWMHRLEATTMQEG